MITENRFLEVDHQMRHRRRHHGVPRYAGLESLALPFAATDRALVVLIENGGIDLGIPWLVDKLLSTVPGASILPRSVRDGIVSALRHKLEQLTDNLLESAELTLNRYGSAKPDPYGDVVVLRDGTATYVDLKRTLIAQAGANKIIDLVILTHGGPDSISVVDGIDGAKLRAMKTEAGRALTIRAVYMMNCVGSSLNQAWIDAGAKVSAGTLKNNYLPEPTAHFFWTNWKAGQAFETAVTSAYRQAISAMNGAVRAFLIASPIPGTTAIANAIDFGDFEFVKDSAPVVQGQRMLTISSDDATSSSQSRASSLATTVLPISVLRALSEDAPAPPARAVSAAGLTFIGGFQPVTPGSAELAEAQRVVTDTVTVPLTQNQVDALVSVVLNIGGDAFRQSTLLRTLNGGDLAGVPPELRKWTKARQNGHVIDLPELVRRRNAEAELFARADGAPAPPAGAVSQSLGAVDYTVPGLVAPLTQPSPRTCWATAIAMMTSWKRQQSIAPRDAIAPGGPEYLARLDNDQVLTANTAGRLYQSLGLVAMISLNPSIDGWEQYLRLYGPLYVDIGYPQQSTTHAVVVTAISGDGSATGTKITYIDPAVGQTIVRVFADFLAEYESPAAVNTWPYVITHWPAAGEAAQSLPMTGVYTYESSVHPPLSQTQFLIAGIAVADAIQIGLASVSIAQAGASASAGTFSLTYDKAQRLLTGDARAAMPGAQATTHKYTHRLFSVGTSRPGTASAVVTIEWEGNAYGEIGTPVIRRDLANSTEWSHSSCSFAITKLDRIPPADTDPRSWPILYTYDGTYDPVGNGYFEFSGEFQINAFGALRFNRHEVVSRSLADFLLSDRPDQWVERGADVTAAVPDIPADQVAYLRAHLP
jgi:Papain-like cysteine protease AvrRpt2/Phage lysozyme